jgi:hypothetical protein
LAKAAKIKSSKLKMIKDNKVRIAFAPIFSFEVAMSTFFDKKKYEIVPIDFEQKAFEKNYGQKIFGDWCAPLKFLLACFEKAVVEDKVEKIIGINFNFCSFPFILGNIHKWIGETFEYYPISMSKLVPDPVSFVEAVKQLRRSNQSFSPTGFLKLLPVAVKRMGIAQSMKKLYFKTLPLTKNPKLYKHKYTQYKRKLVLTDGLNKSQRVYQQFEKISERMKVLEKPKKRVLISGDAEVIVMEFALFELDIYLAERGIEIVQATLAYQSNQKNELGKKARELVTRDFSSENSKTLAGDQHLIELSTIYHVLQGISKGIDGIIYIKPNMCSPCDNVSYILKQNNYFDYPFVELSYDEHSGVNGLMTRLEAFLNILSELE